MYINIIYIKYKHLNTYILKFNQNYINVFLLRQTFNVNFKKRLIKLMTNRLWFIKNV